MDEQLQHIKGAIESLLFVNEKVVTMEQIKKVLETIGAPEIKKAIKTLQSEHEESKSGIIIDEIAGGYQMLSNPSYAEYVRKFYKTKHKEKLSKPALETTAIVAYKQPVTRADIEIIRGVNSDGVVNHLLNKELIKVIGRKDVPGKPFLYGTTKQFMEYFGLRSLSDLPKLEEFPKLLPDSEKEDPDGVLGVEEDQVAPEEGESDKPVEEGSSGQEQADTVEEVDANEDEQEAKEESSPTQEEDNESSESSTEKESTNEEAVSANTNDDSTADKPEQPAPLAQPEQGETATATVEQTQTDNQEEDNESEKTS